jgi:ATP synthase protein I
VNKPENDSEFKPGKEGLNKFIKYSTLGFEMALIIGLGTWGGVALDDYFMNETPGFTIALSLFSVIGSLYIVIKRLLNDNKE